MARQTRVASQLPQRFQNLRARLGDPTLFAQLPQETQQLLAYPVVGILLPFLQTIKQTAVDQYNNY